MAMELVWLGQGGFLIRCGGASICLDPYLSDSCERSGGHTRIAPAPLDPASIDADVFVITHDHMDHLDEGTLRQIDLTAHLFAAPASCRRHLRALGVPEDRLLSFDRGEEFGIGDNDTLSAIVAVTIQADLLILLSDIDGLFDGDPRKNPDAKLIDTVEKIDEHIISLGGGSGSNLGTGGMATKLRAAQMATAAGCEMVIANGQSPEVLYDVAAGKRVGTRFLAKRDEA